MSAIEILEELPKLTSQEPQLIHQRILELEEAEGIEPGAELNAAISEGLKSLESDPTVTLSEVQGRISQWAGRS